MKKLYQIMLFFVGMALTGHISAQCFPTQTYTTTGSYSYTIPGSSSLMYTIEIECVGAHGAPFLLNGNMTQGGTGANMKSEFDVVGGDVLTVFVGQSGQTGGNPAGGGGGGGSAVILNSSDVLIAAGAGGGGGNGGSFGGGGEANTDSPPQGGAAPGASGGGGFNDNGDSGVNSTGGGAGTLTAMGAGGSPGVVAGAGGNGWGGGGGGAGTGGGGGGGYEGGAGGNSAALGGLGGDSYVNSGFGSNLVSATPGIAGGGSQSDGSITVTCVSVSGGSTLTINVDQITNPSCGNSSDGSILVSAAGGQPPYQYSIDGSNFSPSGLFDNLPAGMYIATVMDALNDQDTAHITLTAPSSVEANVVSTTDILCFGDGDGAVEVMGSGGAGNYMYALDGGPQQASGVFTDLSAGAHSIEVTDGAGCTASAMFTITQPDELGLTADGVSLLCANDGTGAIVAIGMGGTIPYQYSIDGVNYQLSGNFTGLSAQTYNVTVLDDNGCDTDLTVEVTQPDELGLTTTTVNAGCGGSGGSVSTTATGGTSPFIYSLGSSANNNGQFPDVPAGTYTLSVVDDNGCMYSEMVTISEVVSDPVTLSVLSMNEPGCAGGSDGNITVEAMGGTPPYMYMTGGVSSSDGTFTGLGADSFSVTVVDSAGCSATIEVVLGEPDALVLSVSTNGAVSCFGIDDGTIIVNAMGGTPPYMFTLDSSTPSPDGTFNDLPPGTYNVTVTDANGCMLSSMATISDAMPIITSIFDVQHVRCHGEANGSFSVAVSGDNSSSFEVIVAGDTLMAFSDDTLIFSSLPADTFIILVQSENGCNDATVIEITQPPLLEMALEDAVLPTDSTSSSITLSASGGVMPYEFSVDSGQTYTTDPIFNDLPIGTYYLSVRDSNGCVIFNEYLFSGIRNEIAQNVQVNLFPNPVEDLLFVEIESKPLEIYSIEVYNTLGQIVTVLEFDDVHFEHRVLTIHSSDFKAGSYHLLIKTSLGYVVEQFVVIR